MGCLNYTQILWENSKHSKAAELSLVPFSPIFNVYVCMFACVDMWRSVVDAENHPESLFYFIQ